MVTLAAPKKIAILKKNVSARLLSKHLNIKFVVEYPKSGGTWLKHMLASSLDIPVWTRNNSGFRTCVMQGHWLNGFGLNKPVVLFRDPRDVMVSFYHYSFFFSELDNSAHVKYMRARFEFDDYENISENLFEFIRKIAQSPGSPPFNWVQFAQAWLERSNCLTVRYEDLRADTASELVRILSWLEPERHWDYADAEKISKKFTMDKMRKNINSIDPGMLNTNAAQVPFVRKGSVGGWTDSFTDETLSWFENFAGSEMAALGYENGRPN